MTLTYIKPEMKSYKFSKAGNTFYISFGSREAALNWARNNNATLLS